MMEKQSMYYHHLWTIQKLPPIKQVLASQQIKSRYIETLINRYNHRYVNKT